MSLGHKMVIYNHDLFFFKLHVPTFHNAPSCFLNGRTLVLSSYDAFIADFTPFPFQASPKHIETGKTPPKYLLPPMHKPSFSLDFIFLLPESFPLVLVTAMSQRTKNIKLAGNMTWIRGKDRNFNFFFSSSSLLTLISQRT